MSSRIRARDRDAILQALRAGVVPRVGLEHIQVARANELGELLREIDRIADGGSGFRLVIGEYGSGKTFFLNLVRAMALNRQLVTAHADLSADRRFHSTSGQARALYSELMSALATKTIQDGGALQGIVERFVMSAIADAEKRAVDPEEVIRERLADLSEMVGGFDFASVIAAYWRAHRDGDADLAASALRWLRGEYSTRTEAREALGVRTVVVDQTFYDHLKLMGRFCRQAGYAGLLVCIDELASIYMLQNAQARHGSYEQILRMLNDSIQGTAVGLGFLLAGIPEFLQDPRRGLSSHEALRSRLAENAFAVNGLVDLSGPVIRLQNLAPEDVFVLVQKIRHVYAAGDPEKYLLPDEALRAFMEHCSKRVGEAYFRTPRSTIKAFVDLLAILDQNKEADWHQLIAGTSVIEDPAPDIATLPQPDPDSRDSNGDEDLASFRL
jgi:hypothetical protein